MRTNFVSQRDYGRIISRSFAYDDYGLMNDNRLRQIDFLSTDGED